MEGNWWKFLVLAAVILGLIWWRRGETEESIDGDILTGPALEQQVNDFLSTQNVTLPEGSDRANLAAQDGSTATGVASRVAGEQATEFSILASLPELESGEYRAELVNDLDETMSLGTLSVKKGGYMLEKSLSEDVSSYDTVRIINPVGGDNADSESVILQGTFATTTL